MHLSSLLLQRGRKCHTFMYSVIKRPPACLKTFHSFEIVLFIVVGCVEGRGSTQRRLHTSLMFSQHARNPTNSYSRSSSCTPALCVCVCVSLDLSDPDCSPEHAFGETGELLIATRTDGEQNAEGDRYPAGNWRNGIGFRFGLFLNRRDCSGVPWSNPRTASLEKQYPRSLNERTHRGEKRFPKTRVRVQITVSTAKLIGRFKFTGGYL